VLFLFCFSVCFVSSWLVPRPIFAITLVDLWYVYMHVCMYVCMYVFCFLY
jgi:hypothetical protein